MNWDETVDLFLKGKEAWNAWAEDMLAKRKTLEADGRWAAEKDYLGSLEPKNAAFVQVPLSATLIFLFLLAVKNRFKIK
jgi:hypothetical protein